MTETCFRGYKRKPFLKYSSFGTENLGKLKLSSRDVFKSSFLTGHQSIPVGLPLAWHHFKEFLVGIGIAQCLIQSSIVEVQLFA